MAKQCAATFSVNLQGTRLFIRGFSSHATVLINTKQVPIFFFYFFFIFFFLTFKDLFHVNPCVQRHEY